MRSNIRELPKPTRKSRTVYPEKRLAAAVLIQAITDLRMFRYEQRKVGRSAYLDARSWIYSNDRSWPYSFLNLCDELQLAADVIRVGLLCGSQPI